MASTNSPYRNSANDASTKSAVNTSDSATPKTFHSLRAEVWKKKLTSSEKLVLLNMSERSKTGEWMYASLQRIADECALARSTVRRIVHGDNKRGLVGFVHRHILLKVASAKTGRRRPATYAIMIEAAPDDLNVIGKYYTKAEQQPIVFPEDTVAIRDWIRAHKNQHAAIIAQVTKAAPILIQKHMSEAERLGFFRNIALKNGMDGRLAEVFFSPTVWKPEAARDTGSRAND